ncbi:SemiSWEET family sugar transporter [Chloroflexota bacterium]
MDGIEIVGMVAGAIVSASLVPQVIRVLKLKSAREISLLFNSLLLIGTAMWLGYGIYLGLLPLILWNAIGLLLVVTLLYAKLKYGRHAG